MTTARRIASIAALAFAALSGCVSVERSPPAFSHAHYLVNEAIVSLAEFDPQQFPSMEGRSRCAWSARC